MTYEIQVTLEGSGEAVRARLEDVLTVLHDFAQFVDATERGAALMVGKTKGLFNEGRWSSLCQRMRRGTTTHLTIERNSFASRPFGALYLAGLTRTHCYLSLDDDLTGTTCDLGYAQRDDHAISSDEFRAWVSRIETASGMRRIKQWELEDRPPLGATTVHFVNVLVGRDRVQFAPNEGVER